MAENRLNRKNKAKLLKTSIMSVLPTSSRSSSQCAVAPEDDHRASARLSITSSGSSEAGGSSEASVEASVHGDEHDEGDKRDHEHSHEASLARLADLLDASRFGLLLPWAASWREMLAWEGEGDDSVDAHATDNGTLTTLEDRMEAGDHGDDDAAGGDEDACSESLSASASASRARHLRMLLLFMGTLIVFIGGPLLLWSLGFVSPFVDVEYDAIEYSKLSAATAGEETNNSRDLFSCSRRDGSVCYNPDRVPFKMYRLKWFVSEKEAEVPAGASDDGEKENESSKSAFVTASWDVHLNGDVHPRTYGENHPSVVKEVSLGSGQKVQSTWSSAELEKISEEALRAIATGELQWQVRWTYKFDDSCKEPEKGCSFQHNDMQLWTFQRRAGNPTEPAIERDDRLARLEELFPKADGVAVWREKLKLLVDMLTDANPFEEQRQIKHESASQDQETPATKTFLKYYSKYAVWHQSISVVLDDTWQFTLVFFAGVVTLVVAGMALRFPLFFAFKRRNTREGTASTYNFQWANLLLMLLGIYAYTMMWFSALYALDDFFPFGARDMPEVSKAVAGNALRTQSGYKEQEASVAEEYAKIQMLEEGKAGDKANNSVPSWSLRFGSAVKEALLVVPFSLANGFLRLVGLVSGNQDMNLDTFLSRTVLGDLSGSQKQTESNAAKNNFQQLQTYTLYPWRNDFDQVQVNANLANKWHLPRASPFRGADAHYGFATPLFQAVMFLQFLHLVMLWVDYGRIRSLSARGLLAEEAKKDRENEMEERENQNSFSRGEGESARVTDINDECSGHDNECSDYEVEGEDTLPMPLGIRACSTATARGSQAVPMPTSTMSYGSADTHAHAHAHTDNARQQRAQRGSGFTNARTTSMNSISISMLGQEEAQLEAGCQEEAQLEAKLQDFAGRFLASALWVTLCFVFGTMSLLTWTEIYDYKQANCMEWLAMVFNFGVWWHIGFLFLGRSAAKKK